MIFVDDYNQWLHQLINVLFRISKDKRATIVKSMILKISQEQNLFLANQSKSQRLTWRLTGQMLKW